MIEGGNRRRQCTRAGQSTTGDRRSADRRGVVAGVGGRRRADDVGTTVQAARDVHHPPRPEGARIEGQHRPRGHRPRWCVPGDHPPSRGGCRLPRRPTVRRRHADEADLEAARQEAQLLAQSLGTPVVPVLGSAGCARAHRRCPLRSTGCSSVPSSRSNVCISRNSHTMMPTPKIAETAERALPLLHTPGTTPRVLVAAAARQAVVPPVPPMALAPGSAGGGGAAHADDPIIEVAEVGPQKSQKSAQQEKRPPRHVLHESHLEVLQGSHRRQEVGHLHRRIHRFAVPGGVRRRQPGASAVAVERREAASPREHGGAGRHRPRPPVAPPRSSSIPPAPCRHHPAPTTVPLVAAVPAPLVNFTPACPAVGAGWTLVPNWPGDLAGLSAYQVEIQNLDGTWAPHDHVRHRRHGRRRPPSPVRGRTSRSRCRSLALMADGSVSPATPTAVITPATAC